LLGVDWVGDTKLDAEFKPPTFIPNGVFIVIKVGYQHRLDFSADPHYK